jgi:hypothetical protein
MVVLSSYNFSAGKKLVLNVQSHSGPRNKHFWIRIFANSRQGSLA